MPKRKALKTQVRDFKKMFRKANPGLPESFEKDNLLLMNEDEYSDWTSCLDPYASFEVNERILEDAYPDYPLRLPKERKTRKGPRRSLLMFESSDGTGLCAAGVVVVRPHPTSDKKPRVVKAFGKPFEYGYGRIQITVPKELIGITANVRIKFPNVPPEAMERALARASRGDKTKRPWRRPRKQLDYVQTEGGHFSKKEPKNNAQSN